MVVGVAVAAAWLPRERELLQDSWAVSLVVTWAVFALVHAFLTYRAHRWLGPAELRRAVIRAAVPEVTSRGLRGAWRRFANAGREAPSWSVQLSVVALLVVATILVTPSLRNSQTLLFFALGMVAASWINVVVMYAVHYAGREQRDGGLEFPGEGPRTFSDYLYFALAVQTTFGTTDVTVTSSQFRRTVTAHAALAFVFNTVIVAMVISLLLGVAT